MYELAVKTERQWLIQPDARKGARAGFEARETERGDARNRGCPNARQRRRRTGRVVGFQQLHHDLAHGGAHALNGQGERISWRGH